MPGCYEAADEPKTSAPRPRPDTQIPAPVPGPGVEPAAEPAEGAGSVAQPEAGLLVGTTWAIGETILTFKDETKVFAKGGLIAQIAPDGLEATWSLNGTVLEMSAMGETRAGTFDGATLTLGGVTATKVERTVPAPAPQ